MATRTSHADEARRHLVEAGGRLAASRAALADVHGAILLGHMAGVPVAEIARLAGVSRPTVYTILKQVTVMPGPPMPVDLEGKRS